MNSILKCEFSDALRQHFEGFRDKGAVDFRYLVRNSFGVWPLDAMKICDEIHLNYNTGLYSNNIGRRNISPELHARFGEWYFSRTTSERIAKSLIPPTSKVLLVGTPTIAVECLPRRDSLVAIKLIDSNKLVAKRFPDLQDILYISSIQDVNATSEMFDLAIIDPPWYTADIFSWISRVSSFVRPGGYIHMPLLQKFTRPSAIDDRIRITEFARNIGRVRISPRVFQYETPTFECEALYAASVPVIDDWRIADLLSIRVTNEFVYQSHAKPPDEWEAFVLQDQVVMLKKHPNCGVFSNQNDILAILPDAVNGVLDSVSARDRRIESIDIWTSRNRVGTVFNVPETRAILEYLSGSNSPRDLRNRIMKLRGSISEASWSSLIVIIDVALI